MSNILDDFKKDSTNILKYISNFTNKYRGNFNKQVKTGLEEFFVGTLAGLIGTLSDNHKTQKRKFTIYYLKY